MIEHHYPMIINYYLFKLWDMIGFALLTADDYRIALYKTIAYRTTYTNIFFGAAGLVFFYLYLRRLLKDWRLPLAAVFLAGFSSPLWMFTASPENIQPGQLFMLLSFYLSVAFPVGRFGWFACALVASALASALMVLMHLPMMFRVPRGRHSL